MEVKTSSGSASVEDYIMKKEYIEAYGQHPTALIDFEGYTNFKSGYGFRAVTMIGVAVLKETVHIYSGSLLPSEFEKLCSTGDSNHRGFAKKFYTPGTLTLNEIPKYLDVIREYNLWAKGAHFEAAILGNEMDYVKKHKRDQRGLHLVKELVVAKYEKIHKKFNLPRKHSPRDELTAFSLQLGLCDAGEIHYHDLTELMIPRVLSIPRPKITNWVEAELELDPMESIITVYEDIFVPIEETECCPEPKYFPGSLRNYLNIWHSRELSQDNIECLLNTLVNCSLYLRENSINTKTLEVADLWNKLKHDMILWAVNDLVLNRAKKFGEDDKFPSEIKSDRSPDICFTIDKTCYIYEVTYVTKYEYSFKTKGSESIGMKYSSESRALQLNGFKVVYKNIVMTQEGDNENIKSLFMGIPIPPFFDSLLNRIRSAVSICHHVMPKYNRYLFNRINLPQEMIDEANDFGLQLYSKLNKKYVGYNVSYKLGKINKHVRKILDKVQEVLDNVNIKKMQLIYRGGVITIEKGYDSKDYLQRILNSNPEEVLRHIRVADSRDTLYDQFDKMYLNYQVEQKEIWALLDADPTHNYSYAVADYVGEGEYKTGEEFYRSKLIVMSEFPFDSRLFDKDYIEADYCEVIVPNNTGWGSEINKFLDSRLLLQSVVHKDEEKLPVRPKHFFQVPIPKLTSLVELQNKTVPMELLHLMGVKQVKEIQMKNSNKTYMIVKKIKSGHFWEMKKHTFTSADGSRKRIKESRFYDGDINLIDRLIDYFLSPAEELKEFITAKDKSKFMQHMKSMIINKYNENLQSYNCLLFVYLEFLSRLAHSLLFHTGLVNMKKDHANIDHIGYDNVRVIINPQLVAKDRSKWYRVWYPAGDFVPATDRTNFPGWGLSPWRQMHRNYMVNLLALKAKVNMYFNSVVLRGTLKRHNMLSVLYAINGRRETEKYLHNMRYLLVNPFAAKTDLLVIMDQTVPYSRCALTRYIISRMRENYVTYIEQGKMGTRIHPITGEHLDNDFEWSACIYSTYLINSGTFNWDNETRNNYRSVLKTHLELTERHGDPETWDDVFSTTCSPLSGVKDYDLAFNPEYVFNLGKVMAAYANYSRAHLENEWTKIRNEPWVEIAKKTGMRGFKKEKFTGQKGYEVVYEMLMEEEYDSVCKLEEIYESKETIRDKMRNISKMNMDCVDKYISIYEKHRGRPFYFYTTNKEQRAGSREIYVMCIITKLQQNPLEKFFARMCEVLPNEIISIPSDERASYVHSRMYTDRSKRYKGLHKGNAVMDCRRWGPRSNFLKYIYFMMGAKESIPTELYILWMHFSYRYKDKRVLFKNKVGIEEYDSLLKEDDTGLYYIRMWYSFVMGMFNYLSSALHACNQNYANMIISKQDANHRMISHAHSDDSNAIFYNISSEQIVKNFDRYSYHLKCANHMLSQKKTGLFLVPPNEPNSFDYNELLSILYFQSRLVPVLIKFICNWNLVVTGKGYTFDINQAISKSLEIRKNGGTYAESYICMRLISDVIQRFHHVPDSICNHNMLPQLFGKPDCHTLMYEIGGNMTDIMRIPQAEEQLQILIDHGAMSDNQILGTFQTREMVRLKDQSLQLQQSIASEFTESKIHEMWSLKVKKPKNSITSVLWYHELLNNYDFKLSLKNSNVYDNLVKSLRHSYSTSYCIKNKEEPETEAKWISPNDLYAMLVLAVKGEIRVDVGEEKLDNIRMGLVTSYDIIDQLNKIEIESISVRSNSYTTKPIRMNFKSNNYPIRENIDPACLISHAKGEPTWIVDWRYDPLEYDVIMDMVKETYATENLDLLYNILKTLKKGRKKYLYSYATVESTNRYINSVETLVELLRTNTLPQRTIFFGTLKYDVRLIEYRQVKQFAYKDLGLFLSRLPDIKENWEALPIKHSPETLSDISGPLVVDISQIENYFYWPIEQKKIGGRWMGRGVLIVKGGNDHFECTVFDNNVLTVRCKGNDPDGAKYFINACNKLGYKLNLTVPEIRSRQLVFGCDKRSTEWKSGLTKDMNMIVKGWVYGDCNPLKGKAKYSGRGAWKVNRQRVFETWELRHDIFTTFEETIDTKSPDFIQIVGNYQDFIKKNMLPRTNKIVKVNRRELLSNLPNSKIGSLIRAYERMGLQEEGDKTLIELVLGGHTDIEVYQGLDNYEEFIKNNIYITYLPPHVRKVFLNKYMSSMDPLVRKELRDDVSSSIAINDFTALISKWGTEISKQSLEVFAYKDPTLIKAIKYTGVDDPWLSFMSNEADIFFDAWDEAEKRNSKTLKNFGFRSCSRFFRREITLNQGDFPYGEPALKEKYEMIIKRARGCFEFLSDLEQGLSNTKLLKRIPIVNCWPDMADALFNLTFYATKGTEVVHRPIADLTEVRNSAELGQNWNYKGKLLIDWDYVDNNPEVNEELNDTMDEIDLGVYIPIKMNWLSVDKENSVKQFIGINTGKVKLRGSYTYFDAIGKNNFQSASAACNNKGDVLIRCNFVPPVKDYPLYHSYRNGASYFWLSRSGLAPKGFKKVNYKKSEFFSDFQSFAEIRIKKFTLNQDIRSKNVFSVPVLIHDIVEEDEYVTKFRMKWLGEGVKINKESIMRALHGIENTELKIDTYQPPRATSSRSIIDVLTKDPYFEAEMNAMGDPFKDLVAGMLVMQSKDANNLKRISGKMTVEGQSLIKFIVENANIVKRISNVRARRDLQSWLWEITSDLPDIGNPGQDVYMGDKYSTLNYYI